MKNSDPYLGVVVTSRNDNHGGDMLGRMQLFVDGLLQQAEHHQLPCELIVVDWNPLADKCPLMDALSWPKASSFCDVRFVTVPHQRHMQLDHGQALPLFQMIGKNVGMRRARAPFVMATNIDILFSEALFGFFAKRLLKPGRFYRCDRLDVLPHPERGLSLEAKQAWCQDHVVRYNEMQVTRRPGVSEDPICWPWSWRVGLLEKLQDWNLVPIVTRKRLHTNACGDMTLMHKADWHKIGGYCQEPVFSMHLDSLALNAACFAGIKEVCLAPPMVTYHMEHDLGSGWSAEGQALLDARLKEKGIPQYTFEQYHHWCIQMRRGTPFEHQAGADWGWPDETFEETSPF